MHSLCLQSKTADAFTHLLFQLLGIEFAVSQLLVFLLDNGNNLPSFHIQLIEGALHYRQNGA